MRLYDRIKCALTAEDVARRYGFEPNRAGFISCPFHGEDNNPSLKLYPADRGFYCFGCGEGGSVINFVMKLFNEDCASAAARINADFNLGFTDGRESAGKKSTRVAEAERARRELETFRKGYDLKAAEYRQLWRAQQAGFKHPLYARACLLLPNLEHWFEENPWR